MGMYIQVLGKMQIFFLYKQWDSRKKCAWEKSYQLYANLWYNIFSNKNLHQELVYPNIAKTFETTLKNYGKSVWSRENLKALSCLGNNLVPDYSNNVNSFWKVFFLCRPVLSNQSLVHDYLKSLNITAWDLTLNPSF